MITACSSDSSRSRVLVRSLTIRPRWSRLATGSAVRGASHGTRTDRRPQRRLRDEPLVTLACQPTVSAACSGSRWTVQVVRSRRGPIRAAPLWSRRSPPARPHVWRGPRTADEATAAGLRSRATAPHRGIVICWIVRVSAIPSHRTASCFASTPMAPESTPEVLSSGWNNPFGSRSRQRRRVGGGQCTRQRSRAPRTGDVDGRPTAVRALPARPCHPAWPR